MIFFFLHSSTRDWECCLKLHFYSNSTSLSDWIILKSLMAASQVVCVFSEVSPKKLPLRETELISDVKVFIKAICE